MTDDPQTVAFIRDWASRQKTDKQIAAHFKCRLQKIWAIRKRHGIRSGRQTRTAEMYEAATQMRAKGYTYAKIGEWLHISRQAAHKLLKENS